MDKVEELRTLAIREKEKLWDGFHQNSLARLHSSLSKLQKHELNALFLLSIESPVELCRFFATSFVRLQHLMNDPSYKCYAIPKKKGGSRVILAPGAELKKIQKHLNYYLQAYYLSIKPDEVHGFVINPHYLGKHCNIVANASRHVGKKFLLNIDLKDFFPGIAAKRVKDLFRSNLFGFNEQISSALTLLTTYKGKLPIGAPTSPVISNFICYQLDGELNEFCDNQNLTYTRYADDLTFSSNIAITPGIITGLNNLVKSNGFETNTSKTRLTTSNRRQTVTGITVNERVNVDRKLLKKTRAMLFDLKRNGTEAATRKHFNIQGDVTAELQATFINRLRGYINFIGQVRGKSDYLYAGYKNQLATTS